ncbi:MAG TPA: hypothetical protein VHU60_10485 [Gaiellaceae bacterium]|nr:hypothetical protein [Gaiellaceae bacterium]
MTAAKFADAVRAYRFEQHPFDVAALSLAARSIADAGLLVVGEPHGVYETPSVLYRLACELGTRAIAFEWSHEEVEEPLQAFVRGDPFDFEALWSLPGTAEFFCGDGRITAGHFALLERLRQEGRLEQAIAFDRLDPDPPLEWPARDRDLAERLLAEWRGQPLLVLTGAFHARLDEDETMAAHLARSRRGLATAMLDFDRGSCWSRGAAHDVSGSMPEAPIRLRIPEATLALVPSRAFQRDA